MIELACTNACTRTRQLVWCARDNVRVNYHAVNTCLFGSWKISTWSYLVTILHKSLHVCLCGLGGCGDVRVTNACTSARALPRSQHIFGSWTISTCTQFVWPSCTKVSKCVCVIWVGGREMVIHWKVRQVTHTHGNPRWGEFEIYRHTVQRQWHLEAWRSYVSSFWWN